MPPRETAEVAELDARVLSWKVDGITSSNHFANQVCGIPMDFSSTAEYLQVFRVPLLEEVRAQLHQALGKALETAGHAIATTSIRKIVMTSKRARSKDKRILEFCLKKDLNVKVSDLILLCSAKPRWDSTRECLLKSDSVFVLARVIFAHWSYPLVSAAVYVQNGSLIFTKLVEKSVWHVVLPGVSLIPAQRIWNAISVPFSSKEEEQKSITHSILQIDPQPIPTGANHSLSLLSKQKKQNSKAQKKKLRTVQCVEDYCNFRGLNDSQRDVVKSALAALLAEDAKPHVRMVQGPPGTGKTAMLVTLLSVLGCLQCRTLISAPTNAAVLEVSKRMMRFFDESKNEEMFSGFCSRIKAQSKQCLPIALSSMVLLASKERLQGAVDGTALDKIFLHSRVHRLERALSSKSGWKATVQSVAQFLREAPKLFDARHAKESESDKDYSQSKASKGKKKRTSKQGKEEERNASFWSFARGSMVELQVQMQEAAVVLTSELPHCHMNVTTSNAMTSAANLMERLVTLMPSTAPPEAETWFSTHPTAKAITAPTVKDILCEKIAMLLLTSSSSTAGKAEFLRARGALLEALKSSPGCALFATKKQPKGTVPTSSWLREECLVNATLVFCTVSGAGSKQMMRETFECAIIDEASQLVEAETAIVTRKKGLKQLILVGDHKQLPATVISKVAEKCGYGRSLFDRLQTLQHGCRHMLNIQYRMTPTISHYPNSQFYDGKVEDGPNVLSPTYGSSLHNPGALIGAYAFFDCRDGGEVEQKKSWTNPKEVEAVISLVTALSAVCAARNIVTLSVGVISPYGMQVAALKQALDRQVLHGALQVEVKTVDGFQGNERDVIIFSAVRSNLSKRIGFVNDGRRLNVAITRGRYRVWIVGNASTLSGGGEVWKKLVADAIARNCFHVLQRRRQQLLLI